MIEIQPLHPDDWRLWRELRLRALTESPSAFGSTLAEWTGPGDTETRWRARLTTVPLNVVVRVDGAPVGMAGGYLRDDGAAELISLWVAAEARDRGVGDAAVCAVIDWADQREVVLSVKTDNAPAITLYLRHGFVDAGPSPDDDGERFMRRAAKSACQ
ncbi:N-acetyltransferase family protein [Nocardia sp. CA-151230]|uniref:GNAT family N-acetyltransferase n=1 Tax=Nocardia sp. CA-151230 TaxID=3239982 RepID=UPI003D8EDEC1